MHDWRDDAACRGHEDMFLPPFDDGRLEKKAERFARQRAAKALCDGCDVRETCFEFVLRLPASQRFAGVWAGATAYEIDEAVRHGDVQRLAVIEFNDFR